MPVAGLPRVPSWKGRLVRTALVWGNCQAAPLADLLRVPLAAADLRVQDVPPVYLAGPDDVRRVHELARGCAVLVSQPVSDDYRVAGCGTDTLVSLLPPGARVVRLPVVYDVGAFPFQIHGYDGGGGRVDAPLTDYHDLRVVRAAAASWSATEAIERMPQPDAAAVRSVAQRSLETLRRRESGLDVPASDLVRAPEALWTMTHPSNAVLGRLARRVLDVLGIADDPVIPSREYLGQRRAAVDAGVARVLGWPEDARPQWVVDGAPVPWQVVVERQLAFYAERPDVVAATVRRTAERADALFGPA